MIDLEKILKGAQGDSKNLERMITRFDEKPQWVTTQMAHEYLDVYSYTMDLMKGNKKIVGFRFKTQQHGKVN